MRFATLILFAFHLILGGSSTEPFLKHLQLNCSINDLSGKLLRIYPAYLCIFKEDGSRIELIPERKNRRGRIAYIDHKNIIKWSYYVDAHHELTMSSDEKNIFLLGSEVGVFENKKIRFDVLIVLDMSGRLVAKWSSRDHFSLIKDILRQNNKPVQYNKISIAMTNGDYELTHFNSFKKIEDNDLYPQLYYLKPGNYIVGADCNGLFLVFDSRLSKIEKIIDYNEFSNDCNTHDVQVLSSGNLIHYSNFETKTDKRSYIKEINPVNMATIWKWPNEGNSYFFSNLALGSVQRLKNGYTLFSDIGMPNDDYIRTRLPYILLVGPSGQIVNRWKINVLKGENPYRARLLNLDKYLENSI